MGNPEDDVENEVLKTEQELQVILLPCYLHAVSDLQQHVTSFPFVSFLFKLRLAEDLVAMLPSCQRWLLITSNTEVHYTINRLANTLMQCVIPHQNLESLDFCNLKENWTELLF